MLEVGPEHRAFQSGKARQAAFYSPTPAPGLPVSFNGMPVSAEEQMKSKLPTGHYHTKLLASSQKPTTEAQRHRENLFGIFVFVLRARLLEDRARASHQRGTNLVFEGAQQLAQPGVAEPGMKRKPSQTRNTMAPYSPYTRLAAAGEISRAWAMVPMGTPIRTKAATKRTEPTG